MGNLSAVSGAFAAASQRRAEEALQNERMDRALAARWKTANGVREDAAELLGIPTSATADEIRAAFRKAVRDAHPDNGGSGVDMDKLTRAKETLLLTQSSESNSNNVENTCLLCRGSGKVYSNFGSIDCTSCKGTGHAV